MCGVYNLNSISTKLIYFLAVPSLTLSQGGER